MWGSSWPVRSKNRYLGKRGNNGCPWCERENGKTMVHRWKRQQRYDSGLVFVGRKSTLQARYSRCWRRERRTYAILAVARTTASGESMIHETSEREKTLRRVRRIGRGRSMSGRCTVCCDPVFSAGAAAPFRSLSAAVFLLPFLLRDSYPAGNDCTFLEFRQGACTTRTIIISAVWSILSTFSGARK